METPRATQRSGRGYLAAAGLLVVVAIVVGTRLMPAVGYLSAFLPAVGGALGGAVAFAARRPRAVLVGAVIGIIAGALPTYLYGWLVSASWN